MIWMRIFFKAMEILGKELPKSNFKNTFESLNNWLDQEEKGISEYKNIFYEVPQREWKVERNEQSLSPWEHQ